MNCRKCGAELHPDQKVCIQCGERTAAGGKFDVEEERHWRPSPRLMQAVGAAVALLILILILYRALHVVPPEVVAEDWFNAMLSRNFSRARTMITPAFDQDLSARMMDMRALAEMWIEDINSYNATPRVSAPDYDKPTDPRRAIITITLQSNSGETARQIRLTLVRVGRVWKIAQAL
ncbi:MAG: zinc ribbon domain-containing protein [Armatimonadota bacterium]